MQFLANLDTSTFFLLNNFTGSIPLTDTLILFFATYVAYLLPILLLVLLFRTRSSLKEKFTMVSVVLLSALIARLGVTEIIRLFYHRPRPFLTYQVHQLIPENSYSFPSGHATFFFALSATIYMYNKKWGITFFIAATLMGIARVMAGVHYPSDIIGGMVIGIAVAYFTVRYVGPHLEKMADKFI